VLRERERKEALEREERLRKAEEARQRKAAAVEAEAEAARQQAAEDEAKQKKRAAAAAAALAEAEAEAAARHAQAEAEAEAAERHAQAEAEAAQRKQQQQAQQARRKASVDHQNRRLQQQQQVIDNNNNAAAPPQPAPQALHPAEAPLKPFPRSASAPEKMRSEQASKAPSRLASRPLPTPPQAPPTSSGAVPVPVPVSRSQTRQAEDVEEETEVQEEEEVEEEEEEDIGRPRFEYALTRYPHTIFACLLSYLEYADFRPLREVSSSLRQSLYSHEHREIVLVRYLSEFGYRPSSSSAAVGNKGFNPAYRSKTEGNLSSQRGGPGPVDSVELSLRDLEAFRTGLELATSEYHDLAREHRHAPLDTLTLRMVKACTRSWNRVVIHLREQSSLEEVDGAGVGVGNGGKSSSKKAKGSRTATPSKRQVVLKQGRAPTLRVWVPTRANWMNDEEVVECEREVWRSGVWSHLRRGDVVHNVACGDFANEGKLVSDSRYLRDLSYTYDPVGHLPVSLHMACLCLLVGLLKLDFRCCCRAG
jgi:chemotaxis protein histidine kinase CheA